MTIIALFHVPRRVLLARLVRDEAHLQLELSNNVALNIRVQPSPQDELVAIEFTPLFSLGEHVACIRLKVAQYLKKTCTYYTHGTRNDRAVKVN